MSENEIFVGSRTDAFRARFILRLLAVMPQPSQRFHESGLGALRIAGAAVEPGLLAARKSGLTVRAALASSLADELRLDVRQPNIVCSR